MGPQCLSDPTVTKTHAENTWDRCYHSNRVDIKEPKVGLTQPLGAAWHSKTLQAAHLFRQACANKSRHTYSPEKEQCGVFPRASVQERVQLSDLASGTRISSQLYQGKEEAAEDLDLLLRL